MKKFYSIAMLLAAAAMAFTSCTKEEPKGPENTTGLNITATSNATKSYFGAKDAGAYPVVWTTAKQVCFSANDTKTPKNVTPALVSEGASISCSVKFTDLAENGTIWAFSPVGNYSSNPKVPGFTSFTTLDTEDAIYLNIPAEQTPLAGSVDECCQAMVASQTYTNGCTDISMTFDHIVAYGKMTITNFAGTIKSVELQFPVSINGGSCKYAYKTGELAGMNGNSITLDPANVVGNTFWFALAPTAGNTGTMKIIVTDDSGYTYTKTIDLTAKALPFVAGQVSKFSANFNEIEKDDSPVYTLAFTKLSSGTNYNSYTGSHDIESYGISWTVYGNQSIGDNIRVGGKTTTPTNRTLTANNVINANINKVVINHTGISNGKDSKITVNSLKLEVSSKSDFTAIEETVTIPSPSVSAAGAVEFVPSSSEWDAGMYYRITLNYQITGSNNCGLNITNVEFFGSVSTPTCATPVISYDNPTVTITCETVGATIHYTLDGSNPSSSSTTYSSSFDLNTSATVKAIAVKDGFDNSEIASQSCIYNATATISCNDSLPIDKDEDSGTISVTYANAVNYSIKIYEDSEHNTEAGLSFWFTAEFGSNHNVDWIAEANTGSARNAYIVITVQNNASVSTSKEIVVSQASGSSTIVYQLVGINQITEGTYVIGALRSSSATDNFYFATSSISSGDWVVTDNALTVSEQGGERYFNTTSLPSGAVEFTLTGNNTDGFTISTGSNYLGYTALSNRKIAIGNSYSSYLWTIDEKENPILANGLVIKKKDGGYIISENSTATSAIRGYTNSTYRAIYFFKKTPK